MGTITIFLSVLVMYSFMPDCAMTSRELEDLTEYQNKFAFDIYQELKSTSENINVSPISIYIILIILYQGAKGDTASEIAQVAHFPTNLDMRASHTMEHNKKCITKLNSKDLKMSNGLFIEKTVCMERNFYADVIKNYMINPMGKNFKNNPDLSRRDINKWAEENTNGKIKNLLPEGSVDKSTLLVLVNAIYFKGRWEKMFNKNLTEVKPFHMTADKTVNVQMMQMNNAELPYMESEEMEAKMALIPFEKSNQSMLVICPNKPNGLECVENKMKHMNMSELIGKMSKTEVNLIIPKFEISETLDLTKILQNMGMKTLFTDQADLSLISKVPLKVSAFRQETYMKVDEEGAEAAAATGAVITTTAVRVIPEIICDKPFLLLLLHDDIILFITRVKELVNSP